MRLKEQKTHCLQGHEYTEDNIIRYKPLFARRCRTCETEKHRRYWVEKGADQRRERHLRYFYGLTMEDFEALRLAQDDQCAICRGDPEGNRHGVWQIDHDHDTGKVRGLLCFRCNTLLGKVDDDIALLEAAIAYLEEHSSSFIS